MKIRFEPLAGKNAEIIESVMACDEVAGLAEDLKFKIRLCVEEIEENILGYSKSPFVEIAVSAEDDSVVISFCDGGIAFNPLELPDPDVNAPLDERNIGGLGIFICKNMMDDISYEYRDGWNYLTMMKKVQ